MHENRETSEAPAAKPSSRSVGEGKRRTKAPDSLDTYAGNGPTVASNTQGAPSLPGGTLRRHTSEIRTGCANKRPSGSVRGAISNDRSYRDRQSGGDGPFSRVQRLCYCSK